MCVGTGLAESEPPGLSHPEGLADGCRCLSIAKYGGILIIGDTCRLKDFIDALQLKQKISFKSLIFLI